MDNFKYELTGVSALLSQTTLRVPFYQRSYAWTQENVQDYWNDLAPLVGKKDDYFLGTVVLTERDDEVKSIIDGQQRIATTAILISAAAQILAKNGEKTRADTLRNTYLQHVDFRSDTPAPRIKLNSEDDDYFLKKVIQGENIAPTLPSHARIEWAHEYLCKKIDEIRISSGSSWTTQLADWNDLLKARAKVIVITVGSETDAYLVFETLNDRGADLTIADLLKNYLFGRAEGRLETVQATWMWCIGRLDMAAETMDFTTFLRHHWSSYYGTTRERDLYKSIKSRISTPQLAVDFGEDMKRSAKYYSAILSSSSDYWDDYPESVRANIDTLACLDVIQWRPMLVAAMQHFQKLEIVRVFRALVAWTVRGIIVGGIGGGSSEKHYCEAAKKIRNGDVKTVDELVAEISVIIPSDSSFEQEFIVAQIPRSTQARYLLHALERYSMNEREPELVPNKDSDEVNLEHVLPRSPSASDWPSFSGDQQKDYLVRIGNLALLQKGPNGKIGNKPFTAKKVVLEKSKFKLTSMIAKNGDWTPSAIDERQAELAKLAVKTWPRIPV